MSLPPPRTPRVKSPPPLIVPGWIDDAGLRPAVFRVLARIARRCGKEGECFERLDQMAAGCKLRRATVQAAIRELLNEDLISVKTRPGQSNIYKIVANPPMNQNVNMRENNEL